MRKRRMSEAAHLFLLRGGGVIASLIGPDLDPLSSLMYKHLSCELVLGKSGHAYLQPSSASVLSVR